MGSCILFRCGGAASCSIGDRCDEPLAGAAAARNGLVWRRPRTLASVNGCCWRLAMSQSVSGVSLSSYCGLRGAEILCSESLRSKIRLRAALSVDSVGVGRRWWLPWQLFGSLPPTWVSNAVVMTTYHLSSKCLEITRIRLATMRT